MIVRSIAAAAQPMIENQKYISRIRPPIQRIV